MCRGGAAAGGAGGSPAFIPGVVAAAAAAPITTSRPVAPAGASAAPASGAAESPRGASAAAAVPTAAAPYGPSRALARPTAGQSAQAGAGGRAVSAPAPKMPPGAPPTATASPPDSPARTLPAPAKARTPAAKRKFGEVASAPSLSKQADTPAEGEEKEPGGGDFDGPGAAVLSGSSRLHTTKPAALVFGPPSSVLPPVSAPIASIPRSDLGVSQDDGNNAFVRADSIGLYNMGGLGGGGAAAAAAQQLGPEGSSLEGLGGSGGSLGTGSRPQPLNHPSCATATQPEGYGNESQSGGQGSGNSRASNLAAVLGTPEIEQPESAGSSKTTFFSNPTSLAQDPSTSAPVIHDKAQPMGSDDSIRPSGASDKAGAGALGKTGAQLTGGGAGTSGGSAAGDNSQPAGVSGGSEGSGGLPSTGTGFGVGGVGVLGEGPLVGQGGGVWSAIEADIAQRANQAASPVEFLLSVGVSMSGVRSGPPATVWANWAGAIAKQLEKFPDPSA